MYNPEAPFGLESFDPELTTEGLMAERKRRGHVLTCYEISTGYVSTTVLGGEEVLEKIRGERFMPNTTRLSLLWPFLCCET